MDRSYLRSFARKGVLNQDRFRQRGIPSGKEGRVVRELLILGTDVHAGEMAEIVERVNAARPEWRLLGYLTADAGRVGEVWNGYPILGTAADLERYPEAHLVPAFGWPETPGISPERWISLVDPSAFVSRTATLGAGCVVYPNCFVGLNARLGDRVFCLSGSVINHDDVLEDRVVVASGVLLAGSVHVESDCYLGQGCTVRQLLRVGRGSTVGMGAVVVRDVPAGSVVAGNPARRLLDRSAAE
jgi:sugar O-acyltransferase (sialic acid O-acetyltransferase NeuD family)